MKVNTLYAPMLNEHGSNFGETRISFPATEIVAEEIAARIPSSNLRDQLMSGSNCRLKYEETEPENWGCGSQDLWSQERSATAESLEDALEMYYAA